MTDPAADAQLVAGHLDGDPSALAAIYDRYADGLHDTAAAMLNDRHDAADVMQDVFLIASQRLDQLRDPERLKPWLFAILRNEVYRRTKQRKRTVATDFNDAAASGLDMTDERHADAETVDLEGEEMAALVRGAAHGLDERDQLVLELSVRQGLDGQDLADALGVSANQSYTLVHRMRERVQRSLGAFCVARAGRKDCDELDRLLASWDGEFTVLIRKRVARHIDKCTVCDDNRRKVAPLALYGAAPVMAAPAALRDQILTAVGAATGAPSLPYGFAEEDGFPTIVRGGGKVAGWVAPTAAASVLLVAAVAGFAWLTSQDEPDRIVGADTTEVTAPPTTEPAPATTVDPSERVSVTTTVPESTTTESTTTTSTTTTIAPTTTEPELNASGAADEPPTPAPAAPPVTPAPTAPPATPAPTPPPTTAPPTTLPPTTTTTTTTLPPTPPGQLSGSGGTIALGASAASGSMTLTNVGGLPVDWSMSGSTGSFSVAPQLGTLGPGESIGIVASVDRSAIPEGDLAAAVSFDAAGSPSVPVSITASVERDPTMSLRQQPATSYCSSQWSTFAISAVVNDESPIAGVTFSWTDPNGTSNSKQAAFRSGSWSANAGTSPPVVIGTWNWSVTASDVRGNSVSQGGSFILNKC